MRMNWMIVSLILLTPTLVAIYTLNFGRWAWKQKLRRGAVGLFLLAAATVLFPAFVMWGHK
jgi:hypothetical protein